MAMAMTHTEWKRTQNSMLAAMNMNEEELSDSDYFPEQTEEDDEEEEEEVPFTVSQLSLRSFRKTIHLSPPVGQQREPWETKKNELNTRKGPFNLTHMTKRKVPGDSRKRGGCKRKKGRLDRCNDHEQSLIRNQIEEIQANLGAECPIFVKSMLPSNVSSWYCLTLPKEFCHLHLPLHDVTLILEVESGKEYRTTFLAGKRLLSGGWKMFCTANKILVDDLLVFRLIRPLKFKVYIMGRLSLAEVAAAFSLMNLNACTKQKVSEENHPMPLPRDVFRGSIQKTSLTFDTNPEIVDNHYEDDNEEFGSNFRQDIRSRGPAAAFGDARSIENFSIVVNGVTIDSRLSKQLRIDYYHLCCSQSSFLHENLLKSINSKLAAEIITETTNIANAIRACRLSTSPADYVMWEKTLYAFELLGMNVGFLRARLKWLLNPTLTFEEVKRRYIEAKLEQACTRKEMRALDSKFLELKEMIVSFDAKIEALREISKRRELIFPELVGATW